MNPAKPPRRARRTKPGKGRLNTADTAPHLEDQADDCRDDEPERGPTRRCIVTRTTGAREKMIRFVVGPDRQVVPDLAARLPGRGLWLSARADVLDTARAKGAFARAARGPVRLPADLSAMLQAGLARRVVDLLGFCRRAGQAVAGYEKTREWVQARKTALVIQASDGSEEERRRAISGADKNLAVAWPVDAATLGAVFGHDRTVHVAVAPGRLAEALINEIERLAGISGESLLKQAGE